MNQHSSHRRNPFKYGLRQFFVFAGLLLTMMACTDPSRTFTSIPELVPNPSGHVPLAAVIRFRSDADVRSEISITDGTNQWQAQFDANIADNGAYEIPVVGMRPGREHKITLAVSTGDGTRYDQSFIYTTPELPANPRSIPPIDIKVSKPGRMEPGVIFLSTRRRALGRAHWLTPKQREFSTEWGMLIALDEKGDLIWYYESEFRTSGIDRLMNGNILLHRSDFSTLEIDLLGNTVKQLYAEDRPFPPPANPNAIPIKGLQTLHHQPHELPNGNFLAFSANGYLVKDYYTSDRDPDAPRADQMVMADTVVEITPQGKIVWSWNTFDVLDPFRIGYNTFDSYWWVRGFDQHRDWSHGNGLSYDPADDSVLVSLRNQSAILKVDRKSSELKWILGRHDGWPARLRNKLLTPVGDLMWPGYQHNPRMTAAGTVILFDNRAYGGARPFEDPLPLAKSFSRGVEYEINAEDMTVRQVWTSGDKQGDDPCFSYAMSDAWRLPVTDNHLIIYAFCTPLIEGVSQNSMDETQRVVDDLPYGGRIVEYSGDDIVFRADIVDQYDLLQWEVYGGFKSPGIYSEFEAARAHQ